jgi:hypothetical protein
MPGNRHVPFLGEGAAATLLPLPDFLAAYLDPATPNPSCAQYVVPWEGAEARLRAAHERVKERANAGQTLPQSFGVPRAGARLPESLREPKQEPVLLLARGRLEAWLERSEPPVL